MIHLWCPHCEVQWNSRGGSEPLCWLCERPGHKDTVQFVKLVTVPVVPSQRLAPTMPRV